MDFRHPGLSPAIAASFLEAARVCLDRHHSSPSQFVIKNGEKSGQAIVRWATTDARSRAAWANESDATRDGAYACVLAAIELMIGFVAIRRAETQTGADYYVGLPGTATEDLEVCLRLEVSGTDKGDRAEVIRRLKQKITQAQEGISNLPAMAGVVGFRSQLLVLEAVQPI